MVGSGSTRLGPVHRCGAVYAAEVQPCLANVQRVHCELLPPLLGMTELGNQSPSETFERYVAAVLDESTENNHWRAFDQAIAQHTRALPEAGSEVLNVC